MIVYCFNIMGGIKMSYCFVIQPFDKDKYDSRYKETFAPAIEKCGITAYRVDNDLSVSIPIETIEEKIKNSDFCFAEISTDNPNVWFELGYAIACGKEIILVSCSEERITDYPFDIHHRSIINYSTSSMGGYQELSQKIESKIKATLPKVQNQTNKSIANTLNVELSTLEIDLLFMILSRQPVDEDFAAIYILQSEMNKKSYSTAATNFAIRKLTSKNMIVSSLESDYDNDNFPAARLSPDGVKWLIDHENILNFTEKPNSSSDVNNIENEDELPF